MIDNYLCSFCKFYGGNEYPEQTAKDRKPYVVEAGKTFVVCSIFDPKMPKAKKGQCQYFVPAILL